MITYCKICHKPKWNERHRCDPQWLVQIVDDPCDWMDCGKPVFAANVRDAAEQWAAQWYADTYEYGTDLEVLVLNYPAMTTITKIIVHPEPSIDYRIKILSVSEQATEMSHNEREMIACPQCGAEQEDFDGFGVVHCEECGYCIHVSATGDICDLCGADVSEEPKRGAGCGDRRPRDCTIMETHHMFCECDECVGESTP